VLSVLAVLAVLAVLPRAADRRRNRGSVTTMSSVGPTSRGRHRRTVGDVNVAIGPYAFSGSDVRRTLVHALDLLDAYPVEARPEQAGRRARLAALLDGVDPMHDDVGTLVPVLASVWPDLLEARGDRIAAGVLPARSTGAVAQLNVSDGGVPKRPVERIEVDFRGVVGDRQATRLHHGRPFQALCLWSVEVIASLAAEGHPIGPGSAGENVTIAGLDWSTVSPGVRLAIGSVLCQISSYAVPCRQNARWFVDGDFGRIHHRHGPISRVYATVLEPGAVGVGDAVIVEPD
jgi:MOSC domain-containing protein YiiM